MNVVIGMLVVILVLLLVRPVKAGSQFVGNFIPGVIAGLDTTFIEEVFAGNVNIDAVDGSGVRAEASLIEIKQNMDTRIEVKASGLEPGVQYIPIYYKNNNCDKEVNSVEKSVNGAFFADENGEGQSEGVVKDSINRIGSVSIRKAQDFKLVACGSV